MIRLLLSSAALAAMSVAAAAADLPRRVAAPAPAPIYVAPIFTWSGFYVGANVGYAWNRDSDWRWDRDGLRAVQVDGDARETQFVQEFNAAAALADGYHDRGGKGGLTGGVQIGFNWQFGAIVVGIEGDINARARGRRHNDDAGFVVTGLSAPNDLFGFDTLEGDRIGVDYSGDNHRRGGNWFGTIRPRIGVAFDRTLIYATGGLAFAGNRDHGSGGDVLVWRDNRPANGVLDVNEPTRQYVAVNDHRRGSNWGWTLGAGVEHAFTHNISFKLEYLYVDLDRGGNNHDRAYVSLANDASRNIEFRGGRSGSGDNFHVVRAGVNFRFGGPAATMATGPVVAAY